MEKRKKTAMNPEMVRAIPQELYRIVFENTGTAMMVINEDLTVALGNHRMEELTGYHQSEIGFRRPWTAYVCTEDHTQMLDYHRRRREGDPTVPSEYEFRLLCKDGSMRNVLGNITLIPNTRQSLVSLIDITERKHAEAKLKKSERRYKDLFENANDIIYVHDFSGTFISANRTALDSYGYTEEELKNVSIRDIVDPAYLDRALENISKKTSVHQKSEPYELLTHTHDGHPLWVEVSTRIIGEEGGDVAVQGIARDITARKEADARLQESEERFKETAELLPCIICEIGLDHNFTYVNKLGLDSFGYTETDVRRGVSLFELFPEADRNRMIGNVRKVIGGELLGPQEYRLKHRDGREVTYLISSAPILRRGSITGIRSSLFDITERKEAEVLRLKQARDEADRANLLVSQLRKEMGKPVVLDNMVSSSPLMLSLFDVLPQMADSPASVLVTGESGTGKELVARSLHNLSGRKENPFVAINCSALPDTLLESELFGYVAGAFTDAKKNKPGKFALAEGGTLFLDEIGDISPAMQVKLLRVLQERVYEPLGATSPVRANVRIVAATNKDIPELVAQGSFREDLYYRINVLKVNLPPLRNRRGDVPLLVDTFIERFNDRYGRGVSGIAPEAIERLMRHDFPGNIRELENIIEHAFVFCKSDTIEVGHLPPELSHGDDGPARMWDGITSLEDLERAFLQHVLETTKSKAAAAKRLNIHKTTLFRKLHKLGLAVE